MREMTRDSCQQKHAQIPYGYQEKDPFALYDVQEKNSKITITRNK